MTIRAGIYTRISDDREVAGQGVGRQDDDCRALAVKLGWEVAGVYPENDTSAFKRRTVKLADGTRVSRVVRPVFDRLLNDLRSGLLDALIADDLDRIARDPRDLEDLIDVVEERNIATATVSGATDLSTDNGVTMARIMVGIANKSSRDTRRRIERKHLQLAREGKMSGGGTRPFGYEDDRLTIREDEAAVIRDAAARVLAGESVRGIARDWVSRPIATVTGAKWSTHVVRSILRSARIAGLREHQGHVVVGKNGRPVEAEWPAIVDIKTHERLRVLLDDPARNKRGAGAGRKYLLSGLVECSLCGTRLISRPAQRRENGIVERQPSMVCASGPPFHGCGKLRIRAEWLEGVVSAAVVELLDGPSRNALVRAREDSGVEAQLQKALDEDREALTELARDRYTRRVIGDVEFISVRNELTQRIEDNARKLADAIDRSVLVDLPTGDGELALAWEDWTVDRRRAVIDAVVSNVIVRPGVRGRNKYTPEQIAERIEIKWTDD